MRFLEETVRENLEILARLRGRHRRDTIEHALLAVNLDPERKKPFREYSLGMKQRLGLAAAIMHEPELLILDEPMNALDPVGIQETRKYLLHLCREKGTTLFISSHVLNEIEQLADVIGVMDKGKLLEETSLQELYRHSRRYVEFQVSDVNRAALLLECAFHISDYAITRNGLLRLYEKIDSRAEINSGFVKEGVLGSLIVPFLVTVNDIRISFSDPNAALSLGWIYEVTILFLMLLFGSLVMTVVAVDLIGREYTEKRFQKEEL